MKVLCLVFLVVLITLTLEGGQSCRTREVLSDILNLLTVDNWDTYPSDLDLLNKSHLNPVVGHCTPQSHLIYEGPEVPDYFPS